jgi:serine/arginine repetitive matrix protein 1
MFELWRLLISAQENIGGIPAKFIEQKKAEILLKKVCFILVVGFTVKG